MITPLLCWLGCFICPGGTGAEKAAAVVPLIHAHAHNDYEHVRPLLDALDRGFCSVEADIFLKNGELLVGHVTKDLRPDRTLEKLYLAPLRERVRANHGRVYADVPTIHLLIDVKTEAKSTYASLDKMLAKYADILSVVRKGKFEAKAVTVVVTGNCDRQAITKQETRYASIDGRTADLEATVPVHLMPWISGRWNQLFSWKGTGSMPPKERAKLRQFVATAHGHGRQVRFWATPERPELWREARAAGVDWLNTDQLDTLRQFILNAAKVTNETTSGWLDLTNGDGLAAWKKPTGEWYRAGDAGLDPENPKRLAGKPGEGVLINGRLGKTANLISKENYGDITVQLEFLIPKGSNSGVKFEGLYEIQIFDSWGVATPTASDCGGIYPRAERKPFYHHIDDGIAPRTNAAKPAGEWQSLSVIFQAPRFNKDGKKIVSARFVKVTLNGIVIHENVELRTPTGHAWHEKESPIGPLLLQADHGPVAFRNIRIRRDHEQEIMELENKTGGEP